MWYAYAHICVCILLTHTRIHQPTKNVELRSLQNEAEWIIYMLGNYHCSNVYVYIIPKSGPTHRYNIRPTSHNSNKNILMIYIIFFSQTLGLALFLNISFRANVCMCKFKNCRDFYWSHHSKWPSPSFSLRVCSFSDSQMVCFFGWVYASQSWCNERVSSRIEKISSKKRNAAHCSWKS